MNHRRVSVALFCGGALVLWALAAPAFASDARVLRKSGTGEASYSARAGASTVIKPTGSEAIPEGATLRTGPNTEVLLEAFPGVVVTVRPNSELVLGKLSAETRTARLVLRSGNVVPVLDPARKAQTNFGIVTPMGTVIAQGTVFSVTVTPGSGSGANTSVVTLSGTVRIERGPGLAPIDLPYGQGIQSSAAQTLAALVASDPAVAADILAAVRAVAAQVALNTSGPGTPENATAMLAAVTSAAAAAIPNQAGAIVETVVQSIVTPGAATAANQSTALAAVSAVTEAAARAVAATNPAQVATIAQAAAAAVSSGRSTTGATADSLASAVAVVTSAAIRADPGQATNVAQATAQGVANTRLSDALAAARSTNSTLSTAQTNQVATQVLNDATMTAALSAIAVAATSGNLAATSTGNATTTATAIGNAVTAGLSAGARAATAGVSLAGLATPVIAVAVTQVGELSTITSTALSATTSSVSTQTLSSGGVLGALSTQSVGGIATTATTTAAGLVDAGSAVLPALDQTQVIVSPSRP